jgi:capsular polysaccharide transport system permease protein
MHRSKRSPLEVQRAVLFALFVRELKTRFNGSWAGLVWVLLEPLSKLLVMVAVFGALGRTVSPSIDYPVFVLTGLLPFYMFRNLILRLMEAVDANRGLFAYRQVKPMDAIVSRALLEIVVLFATFTLAFGVLLWWGYELLPRQPLELIGIHATVAALGFSIGLLFAIATHDASRARSFLRICIGPMYLLSGVLIPVHALSQDLRWWLLWNPMLHAEEIVRSCYFPSYRAMPEASVAYPVAVTVVCLFIGLCLYRVRRQQLIAVN